MPKHILRHYFNFHEVATNVLSMVEMMVNTRTYFIGYTDHDVFTILKLINKHDGCLLHEGSTLPIEHSY
ncbi:hypothetical protein [Tumebacillus permanentifrigoris]|uniref:Uncharacterized protein n=1 Tax=Tumebacillus permanentifrigoris TaxID=378543 RepID=A0A316DG61_9BACL|nr:hypothetical protein [Tumebacillus permanentifrigoris]PWK15553.1 hypothetical protein C7459_10390 [Tumebacillus permanentifrigoris]